MNAPRTLAEVVARVEERERRRLAAERRLPVFHAPFAPDEVARIRADEEIADEKGRGKEDRS